MFYKKHLLLSAFIIQSTRIMLVFEVYTEEMPARVQTYAERTIIDLANKLLGSYGIQGCSCYSVSTPRRLALAIDNLPQVVPEKKEQMRGPGLVANDLAVQKFKEKCIDIEERDGYYWGTKIHHAIDTFSILGEFLTKLIQGFVWPSSMRWEENQKKWIRPIRRIYAVFNDRIVPFSYAGVESGIDVEVGNMVIACKTVSDYFALPILSRGNRAQYILDAAQAFIEPGEFLYYTEQLIEEIVGLVETPLVLCGKVPEQYWILPNILVSTVMTKHQRYIPIVNHNNVVSKFIVVANNDTTSDDGQTILEGNERVLNARLSDAYFFYKQDCSIALEDMFFYRVAKRIYSDSLGLYTDKCKRILDLAISIANLLDFDIDEHVLINAIICAKADLGSQVVNEFPELQGHMGTVYAINQHKPEFVAHIPVEHYCYDGELPSNAYSIVIALADHFDTLAGFFYIGKKSTGSQDPFALRRTALNIIKLIYSANIYINIDTVVYYAFRSYFPSDMLDGDESNTKQCDLKSFIFERLKSFSKDFLNVDISALHAVAAVDSDLCAVIERACVLSKIDVSDIKVAYKRLTNLINNIDGNTSVKHGMLLLREEKELYQAIRFITYSDVSFKESIDALHGFAILVNAFLDKIRINQGNALFAKNRVALLQLAVNAFKKTADFSLL